MLICKLTTIQNSISHLLQLGRFKVKSIIVSYRSSIVRAEHFSGAFRGTCEGLNISSEELPTTSSKMKSQMLLALSLIMLCSSFQRAYAGLRLRKNPPCSPYWKTPKGGCDKRFRPCGTHQAWSRWSGQKFDMIIDREPGWRHCVWHRTDPYEGKRILVQFDGPKVDGHDCWEIYMQPGECW